MAAYNKCFRQKKWKKSLNINHSVSLICGTSTEKKRVFFFTIQNNFFF